MAPAIAPRSISSSGQHMRYFSRSVSSAITSLSSSKDTKMISKTPVASLFALILREALQFTKQGLLSSPSRRKLVQPVFLDPHSPSLEISSHPLSKRQVQILAIPTTYAGLNSGPQPGALVGIVVGSITGFILILYIILSLFRLRGGSGQVVEEKVIRHSHRRRPSRSASRTSRSASRVISAASSPRRERIVREEETVIVEEHVDPPSIVDDDIVEVIEEHSPERRPPRKPSGRSGYRTVDPAEFGGGGAPMRKLGRRR
ncbi:hypothetical protein G647_02109 [Cladophialophora carrionii CBS 160.54]|uniref:Uncharacterized protein n=1 Tax=Cladophialophora carrionii CBS 160.54 TaxID=1279043 RepID=V9DHB1_9EURO|nr:uncharacterized protein G647_02109 [Cladophialophora carrionii CBS 160.54]ETI25337.1 hypothetical protein G647_02109 [Cladophialophora carrionii CBS 160.54]